MFSSGSRYFGIDNATLATTTAEGKSQLLVYKRRRFVAEPQNATLLIELSVEDGDRLDNLANRYLRDPTQYWRICDANGAMRPSEMTETIGRKLRIVTSLV